MHFIYENVLKNLILLWTGKFKDLTMGICDYILEHMVWEAIGEATAISSDTIPSAYSARIRNIAGDRSTFTAENYSFWAVFIAPVLLQNKFIHPEYYHHFVKLVKLIILCLKFDYSAGDVSDIQNGFVEWVVKYEQ